MVPSGAIRKINDVRIPAKTKQNVCSFDNVSDGLIWLKNWAATDDKPEN